MQIPRYSDVTNNICRNIATLRDMRVDEELEKSKVPVFLAKLNAYREDILANSSEALMLNYMTEEYIMRGLANDEALAVADAIYATTQSLKVFKRLNMTPSEHKLEELTKFSVDAYRILRDFVKDLYTQAQKEISEEDEREPALDVLRYGIRALVDNLLTVDRYCTINEVVKPVEGSNEFNADIENSEEFANWKEESCENILLDLMQFPLECALVAPYGIKDTLNKFKEISPSLYDAMTDFGSDIPRNLNIIKDPKCSEAIKGLTQEDAKKIVEIIEEFNLLNSAGKIEVNGATPSLAQGVSVIDVIIAAMLQAGTDLIIINDTIGDVPVTEITDMLEEEAPKIILDMLVDKLADYANPLEIAVSFISLPASFIPLTMFRNPITRIGKLREAEELNNNIYNLLFGSLEGVN